MFVAKWIWLTKGRRHLPQRFLTDRDPSRISEHGLAYFAIDVHFMKAQAAAIESEDSLDPFEELSQVRAGYTLLHWPVLTEASVRYQTVALLQSASPQDFLDTDLREMAYPAVRPKHLQLVLVKLITYWNSLEPSSPLVDLRRKRTMVGFFGSLTPELQRLTWVSRRSC
jgi:hypothetical protein